MADTLIDNVTLLRGGTRVFEDLTLRLRENRIGIIGDNGAGKSSLFRLMCGLDMPSSGKVHVQGIDVTGAPGIAGFVGMMFQNPDEQIVFPTVEEELALGLLARGFSRAEGRERARHFLAQRGLGHWAMRAVTTLSQGQRQHVCWLALQIVGPRLLLLDEPFASLDLPGQALLRREIDEADQQVIISTHALDHVRDFERVIWLAGGAIRGDGPGEEVCAAYQVDIAIRTSAHCLSIDAPLGRNHAYPLS